MYYILFAQQVLSAPYFSTPEKAAKGSGSEQFLGLKRLDSNPVSTQLPAVW